MKISQKENCTGCAALHGYAPLRDVCSIGFSVGYEDGRYYPAGPFPKPMTETDVRRVMALFDDED